MRIQTEEMASVISDSSLRCFMSGRSLPSNKLKGCTPSTKVAETSTLKNLVERIRTLEVERRELMLEIDQLKRMADGKADALEKEIACLRDDAKSLRALLRGEESNADLGQKTKK
jgi:uncharacterized protein (UPF0335 family)